MYAQLQAVLKAQPWPVAVVFVFCLFMTFAYLPYDFLVKLFTQEISQAQEVWFGFMLRGWAAKLTEPLHWAIYAGLAHGFFHERPWVFPCAALYTLQVALGTVVWAVLYGNYGFIGAVLAGLVALIFVALAWQLWRAAGAGAEHSVEKLRA